MVNPVSRKNHCYSRQRLEMVQRNLLTVAAGDNYLKVRSLLRECLERGNHSLFGREAIAALGKIRDLDSMPLFKTLSRSSDPIAPWYAVEALGEIGNRQAIKILVALLNVGQPFVLEEKIAEELGKCSPSQVMWYLKKIQINSPDRRNIVTLVMTYLKTRKTIPFLLEFLKNRVSCDGIYDYHFPLNLIGKVAKRLGELKEQSAIDYLLEMLKSPYGNRRWSAARALANFGRRYKSQLIELDKDPCLLVQYEAARVKRDKAEAERIFFQLAEENNFFVEEIIWEIIKTGEIDRNKIFPFLLDRLQSSDKVFFQFPRRLESIRVLGESGEIRAVLPLMAWINSILSTSRDRSLVCYAIDALGKLRSKEAVSFLAALLKSTDSGVRWSAAGALGKIWDEEAILKMLTDKDSEMCLLGAAAWVEWYKLEAEEMMILSSPVYVSFMRDMEDGMYSG